MRSYPINEARAGLSKLVDRALGGEPQRVTRRGREAVMIVSEADWRSRQAPEQDTTPGETAWNPRDRYDNLGELLVHFAREVGFRDDDFVRPGSNDRPLGADFLDE